MPEEFSQQTEPYPLNDIKPCSEPGHTSTPLVGEAPWVTLPGPAVGEQTTVRTPGFSTERPSVLDDNVFSIQMKRLSGGEIKKLENAGIDVHDLKGGKRVGRYDLFKDGEGNIYVKPKSGAGEGEFTGLNINDF